MSKAIQRLDGAPVGQGPPSIKSAINGSRGIAPWAPPNCALLMDDLDEAAAHFSPLGRMLFRELLPDLRRSLHRHIGDYGWQMLRYAPFVAWSAALVKDSVTLVADKLYPISQLAGSVVCVDAHRWWVPQTLERRVQIQAKAPGLWHAGPTVVIDDAAWSGDTLRNLCRYVQAEGGVVTDIFVAAASPGAAEKLRTTGTRISAFARVPADFDILHARDFFPWLPFSGRRVQSKSAEFAAGVDLRLAPLFYNAGAWLQLSPQSPCWRDAIDLAFDFLWRFETHLGRPALVQDLPLLGSAIALPISSPVWVERKVAQNSPLRRYLGCAPQ